MNNCIQISVIIPTYKPGDYLWECLESLRKQTLSHDLFEVLLVLNGCAEPYIEDINKYISISNSESFIKVYQTDTAGVSNARNIGLDKAQGEYITFIDDDDYVSVCYLEELLNKASHEIISLCYPLSFFDGSDSFYEYYITKDFKDNSFSSHFNKARKYFSGPVYKLIYRGIIGDRRFDRRFTNGEDSVFMFLISDRINLVSFTSRQAIYYRRIRTESALNRKKEVRMVFLNSVRLLNSYFSIYFKRPFNYNIIFFITRILATLHGLVIQIRNNNHLRKFSVTNK